MPALRFLAAVTLAACAAPASAATVVPDDQIVQGSFCVGAACVDQELFGFDTVRLKGTVLRIQFEDTSAAGFPTTDWRIGVNDDDLAGTSNHFSIEDATAATAPFTIEAGAPTDALRIAADGRVGLGTATPDPSALLDVRGNVRVEGDVVVTGVIVTADGAKAGIVPASAFAGGQATVTFAAPFAGGYTVVLTALADAPNRRFRPAVLGSDANGFTITAGKKNTKHLVEVHWIAQAVGE